jgi:hypothetical protein
MPSVAAVILVLITGSVVFGANHKHHHRVPIIDLHGADQLIGIIREDQRVVSIAPHISIVAETGPVCKYELTTSSGVDLPFEAEVIDKEEGRAIVRVKDKAVIDCSHSEFRVQVAAIRCDDESARSESVTLKITVKDTNNHAPEFEAPWYSFEIDEGKVVNEIARLYATDKDCGHPYGKICRYEITNALEGFPFKIDVQGVLSNTVPLNHSESSSHILTIVAHDCGMQKSKSTLVTVNVRQRCIAGIRDAPKSISYTPDSRAKKIMPNAEVITCPQENSCTVKNVEAKVALHAKMSTENSEETMKKCHLNQETKNLLPGPKKEASDEDKENESTDEVREKYLFDGKSNAVIVPANSLKSVIPERFSLSFAMKHAAGTKQEQSAKQNILCESDDFGMNRHHFSIYVRHCKLELLLRREADHGDSEFRAAEWRWQLPEVCDNAWHSYAVLFRDLDNVTLVVDGKTFEGTDRNPEILDDWPLHQTRELKTRLVVGACWHGRSQSMVQFFNGHLSSMYLLPGEVAPQEAIKCLHEPKEKLQFDSIDQLVPGESVIFNNDQSELTLKANSLEDLSLLLQKVEYVNELEQPSPGSRHVEVSAKLTCKENRNVDLDSKEINIEVKKPSDPVLSISGQNLINTDRRSLKVGASMLPDIQLTITQNIDSKNIDVTSKFQLDWCKVHLKPSRDMDLEYFSSPAALIASLNVDFEHDKQGILLKGEESVKGYREILSKIHYFNTRPESYNKRMYTVQCSMLQGKVISNEFVITMTIDGSAEAKVEKVPIVSAHDPVQTFDSLEDDSIEDEDLTKLEKHLEPSLDQFSANRLQNILEMDLPRPKALVGHHGYDVGQGAIAGGAVAVVVVVCVGFLLVLLVIGVLKMRDAPLPKKRRNRKPTQDGMEWDDNGMNITVNPIEDVEKNGEVVTEPFSDGEGDDSSDDGESYHEDDELTEDDEDENEHVLPHTENGRSGLEWDDSTLASVSRTYRV